MTDKKLCVDCKNFVKRHELESACQKFETYFNPATGYVNYKDVRLVRALDSCGKEAKMFETKQQISNNKKAAIIACCFLFITAALFIDLYFQKI
jgi:ABC-type uncharacterized transport system auxiliary subunit